MSDEDISSFVSVTCSTPEVAKQFIEMANGDISQAIELYFQNPSGAPPQNQNRPAPPQQQRPQIQPARPAPGGNNQRPPPVAAGNPKDFIDDIFHHAQGEQNFDAGDDKVEKVKVTFWKNGFQVDDGDLRTNEDPQNQEFLQAVSRGMIPRELQKPGVQLDVEIEDNREKDFAAKPKPFNPFGGKAHTVGGSGGSSGAGRPNAAAPPPRQTTNTTSSNSTAAPPPPSNTNFAVAGRPATKVRIQLPDQLLMLSVNTSDTVGDLKKYIIQNRPDLKGRQLKLGVAFPQQALTNDAATIEQAGLKMAQLNLTVL